MSENKLLSLIQNNTDIFEILINEHDAEVLYQFSPVRRNIVDWIEFTNSDSVLEVGAECGTITEFLSNKVGHIVAQEKNKKYYEVNSYRNEHKENVELTDNEVSDIKELFDVIVDVGTDSAVHLEYFQDYKKKLKNNGKLVFAVDNKYGVAKFVGTNDLDIGGAFSNGISKKKLVNKLRAAGFTELSFYYPLPDYRMPTEIFAEEYLPTKEIVKTYFPTYEGVRVELFDEIRTFEQICEDGLFEDFANSYIVIAR